MWDLNSLAEAGRFFLIIAGELIILFIGITFLVGLLQEFIPPETIQKVMGRQKKFLGNIIGAALGAITPFWSCSTIPVLVGLLNARVPFGATMSFLIASPLLNPVIIALFLGLLGLKVTVIYAAITFTAAVFTGMLWGKLGLADQYKKVHIQQGHGSAEGMQALDLTAEPEPEPDTLKIKFKRAGQAAWVLFKQVFIYLMIGAGIGAFIYGFVPDELIIKWAGPGNPLAVPVAALIGVPMYIRAETIIPISAVLIDKGMSIGAVIALIIGGAGASIPEVIILASIFRRKLIIAFVTTIMTVAMLAGYFFNLIF